MIYVVDTSVFLSDPKALERLKNDDIIIPMTVLIELEGKRNHPDLGYAARENLRKLEQYRKLGSLADGINIDNGSIRIELNENDDLLPEILKTPLNDNRILAVAKNVEGSILLTKDLPLRIKASLAEVLTDDYIQDQIENLHWSGLANIEVDPLIIEDLYRDKVVDLETSDLPENTGVILKSYSGSAIGKIKNKKVSLIKDKNLFDVRGRSAEQRIAIDLLSDNDVGIVSLGGSAGTGKSILAIAAGLDSVIEKKNHKKVVVFRPLYAVGGQELGYLPGTAEEKMSPWAAAVFDALEVFCNDNILEYIIEEELLEVLPLTHIRGRTLSDSYVIIDEAQNLEKMVLLTALSRMGQNSKVVLTHDIAQRDNLRVGKHDGIASVISSLVGEPLFGHITLTRSERSAIAELVSRVIEI